MKKQFRLWLTACSAFFVAGHSVFLSSCNDDLPAASYYTFTGEMMSDYLKSREDFSLFAPCSSTAAADCLPQIGRASCRERV